MPCVTSTLGSAFCTPVQRAPCIKAHPWLRSGMKSAALITGLKLGFAGWSLQPVLEPMPASCGGRHRWRSQILHRRLPASIATSAGTIGPGCCSVLLEQGGGIGRSQKQTEFSLQLCLRRAEEPLLPFHCGLDGTL